MKKILKLLVFLLVVGVLTYVFFTPNINSFQYLFGSIEGNPLVDDEYRNSYAYVNDLYRSDEYFKNKVLQNLEEESRYYKSVHGLHDRGLIDGNDLNLAYDNPRDVYISAAAWLDHPEYLQRMGIFGYFAMRKVGRVLADIRKETEGMSDKEKILYVYNFMGEREYDYYKGPSNQYIDTVILDGRGVCGGFASTSQILFQNIGIKSYLVISDGVASDYHAWNYVEYEGKYYTFDSTFAAGSKKTDSDYYGGLESHGGGTPFHIEWYPPIENETLLSAFGLD
ncbi:MAG: transglutaminase domain-containing protein [Bacilli bacterium]|nr:transglutaminase domain-containing protein [Bacilli bacterium]